MGFEKQLGAAHLVDGEFFGLLERNVTGAAADAVELIPIDFVAMQRKRAVGELL
jgi:hypothetical protein